MTLPRRFVAMLTAIVATAIGLSGAFWLFTSPLGEVTAARMGAAIAVIGGPTLAAYLTHAGGVAIARAIAIEIAVAALAYAVSSVLNTSTEFFLLGLATAWAAGTAAALDADGISLVVGRLLVMLSIGPLLLIAAVWGFDFYILGALPALLALAALPLLGDVVGRYVSEVGALSEEGRVERP